MTMRGIGVNAPIGPSDRYGMFLIFLLLVISASWVANLGADWLQYSMILGALGLSLLRVPFSHFNKYSFLSFVSLLASVAFIIAVRPGGASLSDYHFISQIMLGFLVASTFRAGHRRTFALFVRVMYWLAISSLVFFPLVFLSPSLIAPVPEVFQNFLQGIFENKRFYTLFGVAYFVSSHGPSEIWRNQSIFWEPGMFGLFSLIALVASDSIGGKKKEKVVFILAILSTFAPGAYGLMSFYFGLRVTKAARKGVLVSGMIVLIFGVLAVFSIPLLQKVVLIVFGRDIYADPSIYIRSTDFWLPYVAALKSPFFGFSTIEPYQEAMQIAIERRMDGVTNSFGAFFYRYGYFWSVFFIAWFFRAFSRTGPTFGAFPFVFAFGLMYQPIGFSSIFLFFIFVAIAAQQTRKHLAVPKRKTQLAQIA